MRTQTYGGTCPVCGFTQLVMRYGDDRYLQFDACADCGFGYGISRYEAETRNGRLWRASPSRDYSEIWNEKLWRLITAHEGEFLAKRGYPPTRQGYLQWILDTPKSVESRKSVFTYSIDAIVEAAVRLGRIRPDMEFQLLTRSVTQTLS